MTQQLLFYKNIQPVNRKAHKDFSLEGRDDYAFANSVNSVPLMAPEFSMAAPEYTIVFSGDDKAVIPAVILDVERDRNSYLDENGKWKSTYVPAFVRRYPFILSSAANSTEMTLCIDEEFDGCNTEGRGERFFNESGETTEYLNNVLGFVQDYQKQFDYTKHFCRKLIDLGLLEPMAARFKTPSGEDQSLGGFRGVSREKLKAISPEVLKDLFDSGELELIYLHLNSIKRFTIHMAKNQNQPA